MGWLRDLMAAGPTRLGSFGELARRAVTHPGWPPDVRLEARSFASVLSKLDRGQELEWLRDREPVQGVLAELLECPLVDLRPRAAAPPPGAPPERLLRLDDVRFAAALDLAGEAPCPGLPAAVLAPAGWEGLFWSAGSGAGRSLAGAWLSATGRAAWVRADGPEALARGNVRGAAFVELEVNPRGPAWERALADFREEHPRCCVAAPGPAPAGAWRTVVSAPPAEWVAALARWVEQRLPEGSRLDAPSAAAWALREPIARGLAGDLGSVLGWLGLIDELGLEVIVRHGTTEIARRWVRQRLASSVGELGGNPTWIRRHGFDALVGVVRRALAESDLAPDAPRAAEEWLTLVPDEFRSEADPGWVRAALTSEGGLPAAAVERATARLPPGAWRLLAVLRRARLLVPTPDQRERLAPRWLLGVLRDAAVLELVQGPAEELGEALLRRHGSTSILAALHATARRGSGRWVERVLDLEVGTPAAAAALEATVAACGSAVLLGADLPREALDALLDEQLPRVVALPDGLPGPSLPHHAPGSAPALPDSPERWLLGLVALAEQRESRRAARAFLERCWAAPAVHASLATLAQALPAPAVEPARTPRGGDRTERGDRDGGALHGGHAFELVDRLRGWLGPASPEDSAPSAWELPSVVLDGLTLGVTEWGPVAALAVAPGLPALAALAERRRVPWAEVAGAVWRAWSAADAPWPEPWRAGDAAAALLWAELPAELAPALGEASWRALPRRWALAPPAVAEAATEPLTAAALEPWAADELLLLAAEGPTTALPRLAACPVPGVIEAAWRRAPQAMLATLPEHAASAPELARRHLDAVPVELGAVAMQALRQGVERRGPLGDERRAWNSLLSAHVAARGPGWREAHAWLSG